MKKLFATFGGKRVSFYIREYPDECWLTNGRLQFLMKLTDTDGNPYAEPRSFLYNKYSPLNKAICDRIAKFLADLKRKAEIKGQNLDTKLAEILI